MAIVITPRVYRCVKCNSVIKRIVQNNKIEELWICKKHGEIEETIITL